MFQQHFYAVRIFLHGNPQRGIVAIAIAKRDMAQILRRVDQGRLRGGGHRVMRRGVVNGHADGPDKPRVIGQQKIRLVMLSCHG